MSLISVEELASVVGDESLIVCDVRFYLGDHAQGRREFDASHIPGARFVDLHHELAVGAEPGTIGGRHPLPDVAVFGEWLGSIGVTPTSKVVAYDSAGGALASRLWWMLRSVGHTDVAVLDGGWAAWVAAGCDTTSDVAGFGVAGSYPTPSAWSGVVDVTAVQSATGDGRTVVDSRAAERYAGTTEPLDVRAGHVPGAINIFHGATVGDDGLHRSPAELATLFADVGDAPIVYCGSGVTACHNLLAMSVAGVHGAELYSGSWSDWSSRADLPVATS